MKSQRSSELQDTGVEIDIIQGYDSSKINRFIKQYLNSQLYIVEPSGIDDIEKLGYERSVHPNMLIPFRVPISSKDSGMAQKHWVLLYVPPRNFSSTAQKSSIFYIDIMGREIDPTIEKEFAHKYFNNKIKLIDPKSLITSTCNVLLSDLEKDGDPVLLYNVLCILRSKKLPKVENLEELNNLNNYLDYAFHQNYKLDTIFRTASNPSAITKDLYESVISVSPSKESKNSHHHKKNISSKSDAYAKNKLLANLSDEYQDSIINALQQENIESLQKIITAKVSLDKDKYNIFHYAVANNMQKVVQYIIESQPDYIDSPNSYGQSALHIAIGYDNSDIVNLLVQSKARQNIADENGNIPLHMVVLSGNYDLFEMFDTEYINVQNADGNTPLHLALISNKYDESFVNILIKCGADITMFNKDGMTPLDIAISKNYKINHNLYKNNDGEYVVDSDGNTVLHKALIQKNQILIRGVVYNNSGIEQIQNKEGRVPILEALRSGFDTGGYKSLDLNSVSNNAFVYTDDLLQDANGASILHLAVYSGNLKTIRDVVKRCKTVGLTSLDNKNADLTSLDKNGNSVWHYLAMNQKLSLDQQKEVAEYLFATDAERIIFAPNKNSETVIDLLMQNSTSAANLPVTIYVPNVLASTKYYPEIVLWDKSIIDPSASLINKNKDKFFHNAIKYQNQNLLENLYANLTIEDSSAFLLYAAECGNIKAFKYILEMYNGNCDINVRDKIGQSVLHKAIIGNNQELIDFVLNNTEFKHNIYTRDSKGITVMHLAAQYGNLDFLKKFLSAPSVKEGDIPTKWKVNGKDVELCCDPGVVKIDYENYIFIKLEGKRVPVLKVKDQYKCIINGLEYRITLPSIRAAKGNDLPKISFRVDDLLEWKVDGKEISLDKQGVKLPSKLVINKNGIKVESEIIKTEIIGNSRVSSCFIDDVLYKVRLPILEPVLEITNNVRDSLGANPLHYAVANNQIDAANRLIDAGVSISELNMGDNVFHIAARNGDFALFTFLLDKQAEWLETEKKKVVADKEFWHPLLKEKNEKQAHEKIQFLEKHYRESIYGRGKDSLKLLLCAIKGGDIRILEHCIRKLEFKIDDNHKVLENAVLENASSKVIWYLIKHKALFPKKVTEGLFTQMCNFDDVFLLDQFIKHYDLLKYKNKDGNNLLHKIFLNQNFNLAEGFIKILVEDELTELIFDKNNKELGPIELLLCQMSKFSYSQCIKTIKMVKRLDEKNYLSDEIKLHSSFHVLSNIKSIVPIIDVKKYMELLEIILTEDNINSLVGDRPLISLLAETLDYWYSLAFGDDMLKFILEKNGNFFTKIDDKKTVISLLSFDKIKGVVDIIMKSGLELPDIYKQIQNEEITEKDLSDLEDSISVITYACCKKKDLSLFADLVRANISLDVTNTLIQWMKHQELSEDLLDRMINIVNIGHVGDSIINGEEIVRENLIKEVAEVGYLWNGIKEEKLSDDSVLLEILYHRLNAVGITRLKSKYAKYYNNMLGSDAYDALFDERDTLYKFSPDDRKNSGLFDFEILLYTEEESTASVLPRDSALSGEDSPSEEEIN